MSIAYCYYCLEPWHVENNDCHKHNDEVIYGNLRVAYLQGYRDAIDGKPEDI